MSGDGKLIRTVGLRKEYTVRRGWFGGAPGVVRALRGVDLAVAPGETVAIVGESGSGKSTLGRLLLRLERPTSGEIWFEGENIAEKGERELSRARRRMQIVFQDPYGSLNPRIRVGEAIAEVLRVHNLAPRKEIPHRVARLLEKVDLEPEAAGRYPHEFSGGQRQRIGLARAIAMAPRFLVADEPVSALDVSVQAQILHLLARLKDELDLTILLITHNLAIVEQTADRIVVLYGGLVQEEGPTGAVFAHPLHPYTKLLLRAVPSIERAARRKGPAPAPPPPGPAPDDGAGCPLHPRCGEATEECRRILPELRAAGEGRRVRCLNVPSPADDP